MEITIAQLQGVMPNLKTPKASLYLPLLNAAMAEFEINTVKHIQAFIAQLAHESAELRYMEEIADGSAYEPSKNANLAKKLGNVKEGDGKRYKGRGPIQLTGRSNYEIAGKALGLDLVNDPTIAATPEVGFRIAGWYWKSRSLNALADKGDFKAITLLINGGYNGLEDRIKFWERAKKLIKETGNV